MKNILKFSILGCAVIMATSLAACSDNDDTIDGGGSDGRYDETLLFNNIPSSYFGGPTAYGANLYYGATDQIKTGYIMPLSWDEYLQFPINYGYTFDNEWNPVWGYSFYNGGVAFSNWHDMTDNSYLNQLSVYNESSPSGGNFLISNGASSSAPSNPMQAKYSDYDGCGHIYVTNNKGYQVVGTEADGHMEGEAGTTIFKSVWINNTTYAFLTMKNGGPYASALNEENEGWFKVQFIAFSNNEAGSSPIGYTEAYLANFKKGQADDYMGIIDIWTEVDLSMLPECSILVINFVGSDTGDYGLNTPAYCALDKFVVNIRKQPL